MAGVGRHGPRPTVLLVGNGGPGQIGGYFARALSELGHVFRFIDEAACFSPPHRYLLRRAIDRVALRPGEIRRFNERVASVARECRPSIVLVMSGRHLAPDTLRRVREETGAVLIAYATDDPLVPGASRANVRASIGEYDVYASPRQSNLERLRAHGCRLPVYVRFGYEPSRHFREEPSESERPGWTSDVVFIGGSDEDRVRMFAPLAADSRAALRLYGRGWQRTRLGRHAAGEVFDREFRLALSGAKVAPCLVRRSNGDGHVMRSFEIPACRQFMLAERTEEHLELFEEDVHAAYFDSAEELRDKALYYLARDSERLRMAAACHALVTDNRHTYRDRLGEMLSIVEAL